MIAGSSAPYYVEIGDTKRRVSKVSAEFFLDWVHALDFPCSAITRSSNQTLYSTLRLAR
jgi:hypothetical protein